MVDRIKRVGPGSASSPRATTSRADAPAFGQVLARELKSLKYSAHAQERLAQAGRVLSAQELAGVEQAVHRAAAKGARDSLVLLNDLALVVSVANRTVVTAVAGARMKDSVFTQIDSAVMV
ncbi:MAG: TIGR02530 family flagellar biosynthesis protein [Bacillota bacterium]